MIFVLWGKSNDSRMIREEKEKKRRCETDNSSLKDFQVLLGLFLWVGCCKEYYYFVLIIFCENNSNDAKKKKGAIKRRRNARQMSQFWNSSKFCWNSSCELVAEKIAIIFVLILFEKSQVIQKKKKENEKEKENKKEKWYR